MDTFALKDLWTVILLGSFFGLFYYIFRSQKDLKDAIKTTKSDLTERGHREVDSLEKRVEKLENHSEGCVTLTMCYRNHTDVKKTFCNKVDDLKRNMETIQSELQKHTKTIIAIQISESEKAKYHPRYIEKIDAMIDNQKEILDQLQKG